MAEAETRPGTGEVVVSALGKSGRREIEQLGIGGPALPRTMTTKFDPVGKSGAVAVRCSACGSAPPISKARLEREVVAAARAGRSTLYLSPGGTFSTEVPRV